MPTVIDSMGVAELRRRLSAVDPTVLLVPPRLLRRVIRQDARLLGLGVRVPHRKTYIIHREALLAIVDRAELDQPADQQLGERVVLLPRPSSDFLDDHTAGQVLLKYWRLLAHSRVHLAMSALIADGRMSLDKARARIREIGLVEFAEVRYVLQQEEFLLPPVDDLSLYVEFVSVYTELRQFVPDFVRAYFPALDDLRRIDAIIERDINPEAIVRATRLEGAPQPADVPTHAQEAHADHTRLIAHLPVAPRAMNRFADEARRVSKVGNVVRAAILWKRLEHAGQAINLGDDARAQAGCELGRLASRLQHVVEFSQAEAVDWSLVLPALAERAARGVWTPEAGVLYDLQKACVDYERGIYDIDFWGWLIAQGKTALRRPLPGLRDVLVHKHLRRALSRATAVKIRGDEHARIMRLLESAVHRSEKRLRGRFGPLIAGSLDRVALTPRNLPESVARRALVEELLDRLVERGFLAMGDLRDALSRNDLKLPDLWEARATGQGDQLLAADLRLAASLDGVYHRGEVYLRLTHRFSSVAFGTRVGRFVTQYIALPFGVSFLTIEGVRHLAEMVMSASEPEHVHLHIYLWAFWAMLLGLGFFVEGLLHAPRFRWWCRWAVGGLGSGLRFVFVDGPRQLRELPVVRAVLQSWPYLFFKRLLVKPLIVSGIVLSIWSLIAEDPPTLERSLLVFLMTNILLNTPLGRNVDELVADWAANTWHRFRFHFVAALFRAVMEQFNRLLETLDWLLYSVDEWLRFRSGESKIKTAFKAVVGVVWRVIHYVIRIYVNLLIEPQLNPIKHFPVVTVSHKIMLPLSIHLTRLMATALWPLGPVTATSIAGAHVFLLPGVFGFLVWELKANWRLYAANRPPVLEPSQVGHHGETVLQLLLPGFHSGIAPKLYGRLRRASRKAYWTGVWKPVQKQLLGLEHVEETVRHFTERQFLGIIAETKSWDGPHLRVGEVKAATNRLSIEIHDSASVRDSFWIHFDQQGGRLLASVTHDSVLRGLSPQSRSVLWWALTGFYKLAGVEIVREQIERAFAMEQSDYEFTGNELVFWGRAGHAPTGHLPVRRGEFDRSLSPAANLSQRRLVFADMPIYWSHWVALWEGAVKPPSPLEPAGDQAAGTAKLAGPL